MGDDTPTLDVEALRALSQPRFSRWLAAAAVDWAVVVAVMAAARAVDHPLGYALAVLPIGSRQQALGALFHDASHRLASRARWLNDIAGDVLSAFPLGLTLDGYRRYHLAHHRALGGDGDPEVTHRRAIKHWNLPARPWVVAAHFASDLVGAGVPHLLAAGALTRPVRAWEAAGLAVTWLTAALVAWRMHALWALGLWVAGIVTVFWSGVRLRIWTEHLGTRDTHRIAVSWWLSHFWFPHHIGHHWEHHHWPSVPFWNLGRLRALLPPGRDGAPPIVSLPALAWAFARSSPLPSGTTGATIDRDLDAPPYDPSPWARHVALPLLLGAAVYVVGRANPPETLASLPLRGALASRAGVVAGLLPDALWAWAWCAFVTLLWRGDRSRSARGWTYASPLLVVAWEMAQRAHLVPGTFDPLDVLLGVTAGACAVVACRARGVVATPTTA